MSISSSATQAVSTGTTPVWNIDSGHSSATFSVKHMVVSTVKGRFGALDGTITLDPGQPQTGSVTASIDVTSIDTNDERRDGHLRSDDFFSSEQFPNIAFESTGVDVVSDDTWKVHGNLTIRDVTKPITLTTEFDGSVVDAYGLNRAAFTATTAINRKEFGLHWNGMIETGGAIVGDAVKIELNIAAVQQG